MNKPHKYAEAIKAWADGHEIQWRRIGNLEWYDETASDPMFGTPNYEWRIKPPKKWYRVLLWKEDGAGVAECEQEEKDFESYPEFSRWLTDRIEYD